MSYKRTMNGKVPQVLQELHFDETPTPGSLNPVTSGGVAEAVEQCAEAASINLAPEYDDTAVYFVNSYVVHDGVLYKNSSLINRETWNPDHWTKTTVTDMIANGLPKWTRLANTSETVRGGQTKTFNVNDHQVIDLTVAKSTGSGQGTLQLHLYGECYVFLNKGSNVNVTTYVGDGTSKPTINTVFGTPELSKDVVEVLGPTGSGVPEQWDPDAITSRDVCGSSNTVITTVKPLLTDPGQQQMILHSLGDKTLFIIPKP